VIASRHGTVVIAVADEVLGGFTLDTNSHWLSGRLREAGFPVRRIEVVADRREAIVAAVRRAVADPSADRVLVCGGLGPTPDDLTLEAVAEALERPLEVHAEALAHVEGLVRRMHAAGWMASPEISEANRKMTLAPAGAAVLRNRRGMASGLAVPLPPPGAPPAQAPAAADGVDPLAARWLAILPGVPRELQAIVDEELLPRHFAAGSPDTVVELRYGGAVESELVEPMRAVQRAYPEVSIGSYPQTERRELVIRLVGADADRVGEAAALVTRMRPRRDAEGA
jgi:molybdenum cofactor synthesis domain-containing protein